MDTDLTLSEELESIKLAFEPSSEPREYQVLGVNESCAVEERSGHEMPKTDRGGPAYGGNATEKITSSVPDLPQPFQDAFESAKAQAELEFSNRGNAAPQNPFYALDPIHNLTVRRSIRDSSKEVLHFLF